MFEILMKFLAFRASKRAYLITDSLYLKNYSIIEEFKSSLQSRKEVKQHLKHILCKLKSIQIFQLYGRIMYCLRLIVDRD